MSTIKEQATLKKIHVLTESVLFSLDLTLYPNQLFGTIDDDVSSDILIENNIVDVSNTNSIVKSNVLSVSNTYLIRNNTLEVI